MAIDFRCENCGKLLSVEDESSSKIKCPHCKAKVTVPAGLASLPRPQVPGDAGTSEPRPNQPAETLVEEEVLAPEGSDALMGVMATLMPWVISLFFHAGILVILLFFAIIVSQKKVKANIVIPDLPLSEDLGGQINPGKMSPELTAKSPKEASDWADRDSKIPMTNMGETENKISLYGSMGGSTGGGSAPLGMDAGGSGKGPKSRFFGMGGNAYHIVFVVDRSGSMLDTFGEVKKEIRKSLYRLKPEQTFHVIFFASGKPKENRPGRLVPANVRNKREVRKFMKDITAEGLTNPIPALIKAFAVLKNSPGKRKGKLLYLLTDGEFPDNEKVLSTIRTLNAKRTVHINTILHHHHSPDVMKVLKQIAKENSGKFKFVEAED